VYGNHDYHQDPCACSEKDADCAQVNPDESDFRFFQMPGTSYFVERPELGIEIVGLDLNNFHDGVDASQDDDPDSMVFGECGMTSCLGSCLQIIKNRTSKAFDLFYSRMEKSKAESLVVVSHYPTDYFAAAPKFLSTLRDDSKHSIVYFGGHRHSTDKDSTYSIEPNSNWVVGGGGGYSCDSQKQGFVVGEIWGDSSITTYPVYLPPGSCCSP
jgi:hypothetical protein